MSEEKQIFLAPCSREYKNKTYEHFESTVLDGLDTDTYLKIKSSGFDEKVSVWGTVSGNEVHWKQLNAGDIVLFYTKSGVYTHLAEVVDTEYDV
jgi:putative restriction endonuclease